nr:NADH dehydrogenase subunit 2 [Procloeon bifidum]
MMLTPFFLIFIFTLFFSSIISISSSTWLGAWLGLEVNLMSFIPLVLFLGGASCVESMLKYFLVQAFSSLLFLMSLILFLYHKSSILFGGVSEMNITTFIMLPLMIKLGAAPFHFWFPAVASSLDWLSNFILMTWQKLSPMILVYYLIKLNFCVVAILILSSVIGGLGGLNQTSLRKLMAYSSINHLSWMLISGLFGASLVVCYYVIYSITNFIVAFMFYKLNLYFLSQLFYLNSNFSVALLFINLFSFGGLPPFIGFVPKWFVLDAMLSYSMNMLAFVMVMFSLVSLFYYLRLGYAVYSQCSTINLLMPRSINWNLYIIILSVVSLVGLLFLPLFMTFV